MKQDPQTRRIAERMAPGVLSKDGFLGTDPRRLEEIIETDRSTVVGLATTHEELAERLREAFEAARARLGTPVQVASGLTAVYWEAMGRIPCPWGGCGTFPKGEVELINAATGRRILFTALSVHLIARHGFYQGRGSRYRLDPATIAGLFGIGRPE